MLTKLAFVILIATFDLLNTKKMKLEIKKTKNTTSLWDGDLEVCCFVTGSSRKNGKYAKITAAASDMLKVCESIEEVYSELMADDSPKLPIRKFEYIARLIQESRKAIKKATE